MATQGSHDGRQTPSHWRKMAGSVLLRSGTFMATADLRKGYLLGLTTFCIWGMFPLYFKSIEQYAALGVTHVIMPSQGPWKREVYQRINDGVVATFA